MITVIIVKLQYIIVLDRKRISALYRLENWAGQVLKTSLRQSKDVIPVLHHSVQGFFLTLDATSQIWIIIYYQMSNG